MPRVRFPAGASFLFVLFGVRRLASFGNMSKATYFSTFTEYAQIDALCPFFYENEIDPTIFLTPARYNNLELPFLFNLKQI